MRVRPSSGSVLPVRSCTTRATIAATVRQDSRRNTVTAVNAMFLASHAQVSSNRYVHFAPGRAHGTCATSTPCSGQRTRGAADSRKVRVVPVSTVRHRLVPTLASYPGHDRRHCAHLPAVRALRRTDTTRISPSPSGSGCIVTSPMTMPWTPINCRNTLVLRMPCSPPSFRSLSKTKTTAEHGMSHQTRWSGTHNNVTRAPFPRSASVPAALPSARPGRAVRPPSVDDGPCSADSAHAISSSPQRPFPLGCVGVANPGRVRPLPFKPVETTRRHAWSRARHQDSLTTQAASGPRGARTDSDSAQDKANDAIGPTGRGVAGQPCVRLFGDTFVGTSRVSPTRDRYPRRAHPMTTATATRTRRTPGLSAEQRRARQDELLATLADGVLELTTSDGWRRYLRAMATLRTYSTGNTHISESRECPQLWRVLVFVQPSLG